MSRLFTAFYKVIYVWVTKVCSILTPGANLQRNFFKHASLKDIFDPFYLHYKYCKMPPKRRSLVGRITAAARRMLASREAETPQETRSRTADQRTRQATSRAAETPQETRSRTEDQRTRQATSRAAEESRGRFDARKIEQDKLLPEKPKLQSSPELASKINVHDKELPGQLRGHP